MPISLPGYSQSSSSPTLRGASVSAATSAAAQQGRALAGLGNAITDVAKPFHERAIRQMEQQNAADITEFKTSLRTSFANFQQELRESGDHNAAGYKDKWLARLDEEGSTLLGADSHYSPATRERASLYLQEFSASSQLKVQEIAEAKTRERTAQAYQNGINQIMDNYVPGDHASRQHAAELIDDNDWQTPEQKEAALSQLNKTLDQRDALAAVVSDPKAWKENNPAPAPGETQAQWDQKNRRADQAIRQIHHDFSDEVSLGIFNETIQDEETIREMGESQDIDPRVIEAEVVSFHENADTEEANARRSPEAQTRLAGAIASGIAVYDVHSAESTLDYHRLRTMAESLEDPAQKAAFLEEIKNTRDGQKAVINTEDDAVRDAFKSAISTGTLGITKASAETQSLSSVLHDGFLKDTTKLTARGYTEEQAAAIANKKKPTLGQLQKLGVDSTQAKLLIKKSLTNPLAYQQDLVRIFDINKGESTLGESFESQVFEAIINQQSLSTALEIPGTLGKSRDAVAASHLKIGKTRQQIENYLRANPKASYETKMAFLSQTLGVQLSANNGAGLLGGLIDPMPELTITPEAAATGVLPSKPQ